MFLNKQNCLYIYSLKQISKYSPWGEQMRKKALWVLKIQDRHFPHDTVYSEFFYI
jgi:hypothetical protein